MTGDKICFGQGFRRLQYVIVRKAWLSSLNLLEQRLRWSRENWDQGPQELQMLQPVQWMYQGMSKLIEEK